MGGSSTTTTSIPGYMESGIKDNIARAKEAAQIGYVPYYGPDVAAFNPTQEAAWANTGQAADAFGLAAPSSPMAGMPAPQEFAGGVQGYSSFPLYQQGLEQLKANAPGQYDAIMNMFIDPLTGRPRNSGQSAQAGGYGDQRRPMERSFESDQRSENWGDAGSMTGGPGWGDIGVTVRDGTLGAKAFDAAFGNPFGAVQSNDGGGGMGGGK